MCFLAIIQMLISIFIHLYFSFSYLICQVIENINEKYWQLAEIKQV